MPSWTYDFGAVKSAGGLRRKAIKVPRYGVTTDEHAAIEEAVRVARDAAAVIVESPVFADKSVNVFASGNAELEHLPVAAVVEDLPDGRVDPDGEPIKVPTQVQPGALESVTITLTQNES